MTRTSINPGRVDWSGENPGIYLNLDPAGDYTALALFFRVVLSPFGRGHAALVLGEPDQAKGWPDVPNFIMTDNQRMMRWIVDGWVTKMPTFVGRTGLPAMSVPCGFTPEGLPVGLQIIGPRYGDDLVLRASHAFEKLRAIELPGLAG